MSELGDFDPEVEFHDAAIAECSRLAKEIVDEIKHNPLTPYDPRPRLDDRPHLRDSFYVEESADGVDVRSVDDYWVYVEYGHRDVAWGHNEHRWIPGQPFVAPAVEIVRARNSE